MHTLLFYFTFPLYLAFVSRWHGGGFFNAPKSVKNVAWALPFGGVSYYLLFTAGFSPTLIAVGSIISFALCVAGKATGHGGFMDLGAWRQIRKREALEFILNPVRGKIPEKLYDALGLSIVGMAAVSGAALAAVISGSALASLCIAIGGAAKALAYVIGWSLRGHIRPEWWDDLDEPTEIGEILTGFFAGVGLSFGMLEG